MSIASVPVLIDALGDKKPEVRVEVAKALSEIGLDARDAVPALMEVARNDEAFVVRKAAADALETIELTGDTEEDSGKRTKIKVLVNTIRLEDNDWLVKREAANQLADLGEDASRAVPQLIKVLEDRSDWYPHYNEVIRSAVTALGNIGPEAVSADPALIKLMENKDYDVRLAVVIALGKIGPKSDSAVIDALINALRGEPEFTEARHALTRVLPERFEYLAYTGMFYGDPDRDVRREAAASLGNFESHSLSAVPALLDAVSTDIDNKVWRQAALSIYNIEPGGQSALVAVDKAIDDPKSPPTREAAVEDLKYARPDVRDAWLPRIIYRLDDIDENVRFSAVQTLAEYKIGSEMVCKALNRVALEDKSLKVKKEALKTLDNLKNKAPSR